ncbi:hypothetical protein K438DRAFT_1993089 [Mycena galopus ATCC 62051]|nr:hypothetical protein K438DRAFT_1993089 [Mycena galopus ATCC 62051]
MLNVVPAASPEFTKLTPPPPPNPLSRRSPPSESSVSTLPWQDTTVSNAAHRSHGPLVVRDLAFNDLRGDGVASRRRFFSFHRIAATRAVSLGDGFRCPPPDAWLAFLHIPRPTSSLFSSHPSFSASASRAPPKLGPVLLAPGVASKPGHFHPAHHTNATYPPTHILHPHPTPHAVPQLSRDADVDGLAWRRHPTETEVGTPVEGSRCSVQGSAALNSARLADPVPTGDFAAASALSPVGGQGSAAQLLAADVDEPASESGTADDTNTAGDSNGDGKEKKMENCKKSNLIQRFKEKMHRDVGSSSS